MNLTDEWKAGKLKQGWYWVTNSKKGVVPDQYMPDDNWLASGGFNVIEVLAPCDYDHFVELTEKVKELGKDLSSLTDDRKDETDGLLSIATLGTSSLVKGVVKSIKKAGDDLDD